VKPVRLPQQLEERLYQEKDNRIKFILLQELADKAVKQGKLEYAYYLYERAFEVAQNMGNKKRQFDTLVDLGAMADNLGQTDLASKHLSNALKIVQETRNFRALSTVYGRLAVHSIKIHRPDLAAQYFELANEAANRAKTTRVKDKKVKTEIISPRRRRKSEISPIIQRAREQNNQIEQGERRRTTLRRTFFVAGALFIFAIASIVNHIIFISSVSIIEGITLAVLIIGLGLLMFLSRTYFSSPRKDR